MDLDRFRLTNYMLGLAVGVIGKGAPGLVIVVAIVLGAIGSLAAQAAHERYVYLRSREKS